MRRKLTKRPDPIFVVKIPILWHLLTDKRKLGNMIDVLRAHKLTLVETSSYPYFTMFPY